MPYQVIITYVRQNLFISYASMPVGYEARRKQFYEDTGKILSRTITYMNSQGETVSPKDSTTIRIVIVFDSEASRLEFANDSDRQSVITIAAANPQKHLISKTVVETTIS